MKEVRNWQGMTAERFAEEVRPLAEPALLKGLLADWPIVREASISSEQALRRLASIAVPGPFEFVLAPTESKGLLHYQPDLKAFTYSRRSAPFAEIVNALCGAAQASAPPTIAVQSIEAERSFPGFAAMHPMPLLPSAIEPRLWISNRAKVATHNDPLDNVACVVAGRRRFTLFPPEEIGNLYMGPLTNTPAGTPISMVHLTEPDFGRYPRFAEALEIAQVAELEPGDVLFIPYHWYHHVEALDAINVLINYWWDDAEHDGGSPWDAMLHAVMAIRHLPENQRRAWQASFDHHVFMGNGDPGEHLPEFARGSLAPTTPEIRAAMRQELRRQLG